MKTQKLKAILIALFFVSINVSAQDEKVPQPDFVNTPAYYMKGTADLKNFSRETPVMAGKIGASVFELDGLTSATRLKSTEPYVMIVKAGDADPSTGLFLYKLEPVKKKRKAMMAKISMSGKMDMSKDQVPYKLEKIADKIFKISPDQKLEPGEYMFIWGLTAYTFGIE